MLNRVPNRPTSLRFGLALSLLGAVAVAATPVLPIVRPEIGDVGPAVLLAAVAAALTALAVPGAAFAAAHRWAPAGGALLAGAGGIAAGAVLADLTLYTDAIDANRFELFRPVTAAALAAGPGAALLLAGHVCSVLAGIAGAVTVARAPRTGGGTAGVRPGLPVLAGIVGSVIVVAAGLLAPVVVSADPLIVARGVLDAPAPTALGGACAAVAALVTVAWALGSGSTAIAVGAITGTGLAAFALLTPRVVAGLAGERLSPTAATVAGSIAAALLVAFAVAMPAASARRNAREVQARGAPAVRSGTPRSGPVHAVAGILGLVTAALAVGGALLPMLSVPAGYDVPDLPHTRVLVVAGLLVAAASVWLLLSAYAEDVRPGVAVPTVLVVTAGAAVLHAWVVAAELPGVGAGPGIAVVVCAVIGAAATGVAVVAAGAAERDHIDTSVDRVARSRTRLIAAAAAVVSFAGLAVPLYRGAGSVLVYPWGFDVWGRMLLAVAVVVATVVAMRSRSARGGALLLGAAAATAGYASSWVLVRSAISEPVAVGWAAPVILGTVLLLVAAWLTFREEIP